MSRGAVVCPTGTALVSRARVAWFFGLFLVSGFCSLVYEVVWLRLAMASFGVTTPLVSIVLSVFMAGLALGSWAVGRLSRRFEARSPGFPLRLYALAELLIGVSGLVVPHALEHGRTLLERVGGGTFWSSTSYYLASGAWVTLTLVPFCSCMGATFPAAMWAIRARSGSEARQSFSYLYVANVLGATSGTLVSAFFMIELLGFRSTLLVTAALNAGLAACAFALSRAPGSIAPSQRPQAGIPAWAGGREWAGTPWVLFTTGLASLGMEVVWTRQFTPYVGTFVYAFATILAVYLAATWLGSRTYRWWARVGRDDRGDWAVAWAAAGFLSLLPLAASDPRLPLGSGPAGGAMRVALGLVLYCAALGFLTPMLVDRWSGGDPERAGAAYAVNVLGGIVGPLLASFCLLPQLGERGALCALAAPLFAIGLLGSSAGPQPVSALAASRGNGRRAVLAVVAGATLALVALTRDFETTFPRRVVRRDSTATVTVVGEDMGKRLLVNGIGLAFLTPVTKMMSHLPLAFLPAPPRDCLVICFGMGTSYRSSLSWGIRTTAVELVPSVPALFSYFHDDGSELLKSPLGRIIIDDGRRFLERSPDQFDVITLDPPPPVEAAGSSLLYSREFYAVLKKRLRPGGILQQWLPNFPNTEPVILASVRDTGGGMRRSKRSSRDWAWIVAPSP